MRGGSQSHLMRCSDDGYYVVKFANSPQGSRILTNELLGMQLASALGLPIAAGRVILVSDKLIRLSAEMIMHGKSSVVPCKGGLCFGSLYQGDPRSGNTFDHLSAIPINQIENINDFSGFLVFDVWTCNGDSRQIVLFRTRRESLFRASMIDQGDCFRRNRWNFHHQAKFNLYAEPGVYRNLQGIKGFEPWLSELETRINEGTLLKAAQCIPPAWYNSDSNSLLQLLNKLNSRRDRVRTILLSLRNSCPNIFPNWNTIQTGDSISAGGRPPTNPTRQDSAGPSCMD
jgi:hypothetical protein